MAHQKINIEWTHFIHSIYIYVNLRVGAEGRGHPLHHRVACGGPRETVRRPRALQFVSEGIVLHFVPKRAEHARPSNVHGKSSPGSVFGMSSSPQRVSQERIRR